MSESTAHEALQALVSNDRHCREQAAKVLLAHVRRLALARVRNTERAEDIAQDVLCKLLSLRPTARPFVAPSGEALGYVTRMVHNRGTDLERKSKWEKVDSSTITTNKDGGDLSSAIDSAVAPEPDTDDRLETSARRREIERMVVEVGCTRAEKEGWDELQAILFDGLTLREVLVESGKIDPSGLTDRSEAVRARDAASNRHRLLRNRLRTHVDGLEGAGIDVSRHRENLRMLLRRQMPAASNVKPTGRVHLARRADASDAPDTSKGPR